MGLALTKTIDVWPVGSPSVKWDGQGNAEWHWNDRAIIAMRSDHKLDRLSVSLDRSQQDKIELEGVEPSRILFLELPTATIGTHRLTATAECLGTGESRAELDFVVSEAPQRNQFPIALVMEPPAPTLEQLAENKVKVEIVGPRPYAVSPTVRLQTGETLFEKTLQPLPLPVKDGDWQEHFARHFLSDAKAQRACDYASTILLHFDAGELGELEGICEREFKSLRWILATSGQRSQLHLLNHESDPSDVQITYLSFSSPDKILHLSSDDFQRGYRPPQNQGGLYIAQFGDVNAAIIVPPQELSLADLNVQSQFTSRSPTFSHSEEILDLITHWANATVTARLFTEPIQQRIVTKLHEQLFHIIVDEKWAKLESDWLKYGGTDRDLRALIHALVPDVTLSALLHEINTRYREALWLGLPERVEFVTHLLTKYPRIVRSEVFRGKESWLAEFALRLASAPESVSAWSGKQRKSGLQALFDSPIVMRIARFMFLVDCRDQRERTKNSRYTWKWNETAVA